MDRAVAYQSSIPADAKVRKTSHHVHDYFVGKELVGTRVFDKQGRLKRENSYRNGQKHGLMFYFDEGNLYSRESWENGLEHGIAYQWHETGELIGTYEMDRGTGWDLWYQVYDGCIHLSEARYMKDGRRYGRDWGFLELKLYIEALTRTQGELCIERQWNSRAGLRRGYPKYYLHHNQISGMAYRKLCRTDPTLPPYRKEDNLPNREFPEIVLLALVPRPLQK